MKNKAKKANATKPIKGNPNGLTAKLQIAAGVFVPMLALGLWLNGKGFFG